MDGDGEEPGRGCRSAAFLGAVKPGSGESRNRIRSGLFPVNQQVRRQTALSEKHNHQRERPPGGSREGTGAPEGGKGKSTRRISLCVRRMHRKTNLHPWRKACLPLPVSTNETGNLEA